MLFKAITITSVLAVLLFIFSCDKQSEPHFDAQNTYPWCIVAFDSLERTPAQRLSMLKEFGFNQYAYDGEKEYLADMATELKLAAENKIEIISVWLWLNAKRASAAKLSPANEKMFDILERTQCKTTLWLSFSNNFFNDKSHEESIDIASKIIKLVSAKAGAIGCKVALYNHGGWFGRIHNQVELIKLLPHHDLSIVYNFHHGHQDIEDFPDIVKTMMPFLAYVNLNGMSKEGPKILPIGKGDHEKKMIQLLIDAGYSGPWGILGHEKNKDVKLVLEENIRGLKSFRL